MANIVHRFAGELRAAPQVQAMAFSSAPAAFSAAPTAFSAAPAASQVHQAASAYADETEAILTQHLHQTAKDIEELKAQQELNRLRQHQRYNI